MLYQIFFQILNYSGLSATLLAVWFFSSHKYKIGFAVSIVSCIFWIAIAYIDNVPSLLILNVILLFLDIRGYFKKDVQKNSSEI
ncbi:MAG TPA: hypothetical protein ENI54_05430 [bacterium]|nr:hypothetical protein [bacterium]